MKEVDQLIYQRMIADTGLVAMLGSADRMRYSFQPSPSQVPQLNFFKFSAAPGLLVGDFGRTLVLYYQFNIFSTQYVDVASRLMRLFDGHVFDIPGTFVEAGQVSSVYDSDGVEGFDEGLEVNRKDVQFRFFVVPMAQAPI